MAGLGEKWLHRPHSGLNQRQKGQNFLHYFEINWIFLELFGIFLDFLDFF
jgi:hypothetical protein